MLSGCGLSPRDSRVEVTQIPGSLDSFTVSLHRPNGRHMPAVRAVQGDCEIVYFAPQDIRAALTQALGIGQNRKG